MLRRSASVVALTMERGRSAAKGGDTREQSPVLSLPGAVGWNLTPEQVAKLDTASNRTLPYPYWHQRQFRERNPRRCECGQETGQAIPRVFWGAPSARMFCLLVRPAQLSLHRTEKPVSALTAPPRGAHR
jgi:hypothetical protein